jgi:hypothetical protein
LGISVWVQLYGGTTGAYDDHSFWSTDIGYAKVDGKWGISLRKVEGDYSDPEGEHVEEWLFNDAPRSLRLEAVERIPDLLEKLSKEAVKATTEINAKLADVQAIVGVVNVPAQKPKQGGSSARVSLIPRVESK